MPLAATLPAASRVLVTLVSLETALIVPILTNAQPELTTAMQTQSVRITMADLLALAMQAMLVTE